MLVVVAVCRVHIYHPHLLSLLAVPLASLISGALRTVIGWHNEHRLSTRLAAETDDLGLSHHILPGHYYSGLCVILGVDPHKLLLLSN